MEDKNTKKILIGVIVVLVVLCISLGICFKYTKGKPIKYDKEYVNKITNNEDANNENNLNKEDVEDDETDCEKYELAFKSENVISKDYSNLISKLDYSIMTRYYCYNDLCKNLEKQLVDYYKEDNPNSKKTSGFADYIVRLSNGKLKETVNNKTTTLNGIKNVKSVVAHFSVSEGVILFYLDTSNNLYIYRKNDDGKRESKLLYNKVKDFAVFEGNSYLSKIIPSEGQNIVIGLHTTDNKFLISFYSFDKYINIKEFPYNVMISESGEMPNIYLSQYKEFNYEKHNDKEIITKLLFVSNNTLYIVNSDNELLSIDLNSNYCKDNYKLVKESKIKDIKQDDKNINIKYEDNSEQSFVFSNKIDIN